MWCSTRSRAEPTARACRPGRLAAFALATTAAAASLLGHGLAWANTPAGTPVPHVNTPTASHAQLPGSRLQGQGLLRYLGLRVYQARLWTLPGFRATQALEQPLVLELEYLRNLKGAAIAERSLQEMRRVGPIDEAQGQRWLAEMQRLFPDVQAGDRVSGVLLPGQGARFWLNQKLLGQIDEPQFARLFFGIWLAPATSEPDLRTALLGPTESGPR